MRVCPAGQQACQKPCQLAACYSELLLYALLMVQPVLGLLHTNAHGNKVNFFFLFRLPAIVEQDDELAEVLIQTPQACPPISCLRSLPCMPRRRSIITSSAGTRY